MTFPTFDGGAIPELPNPAPEKESPSVHLHAMPEMQPIRLLAGTIFTFIRFPPIPKPMGQHPPHRIPQHALVKHFISKFNPPVTQLAVISHLAHQPRVEKTAPPLPSKETSSQRDEAASKESGGKDPVNLEVFAPQEGSANPQQPNLPFSKPSIETSSPSPSPSEAKFSKENRGEQPADKSVGLTSKKITSQPNLKKEGKEAGSLKGEPLARATTRPDKPQAAFPSLPASSANEAKESPSTALPPNKEAPSLEEKESSQAAPSLPKVMPAAKENSQNKALESPLGKKEGGGDQKMAGFAPKTEQTFLRDSDLPFNSLPANKKPEKPELEPLSKEETESNESIGPQGSNPSYEEPLPDKSLECAFAQETSPQESSSPHEEGSFAVPAQENNIAGELTKREQTIENASQEEKGLQPTEAKQKALEKNGSSQREALQEPETSSIETAAIAKEQQKESSSDKPTTTKPQEQAEALKNSHDKQPNWQDKSLKEKDTEAPKTQENEKKPFEQSHTIGIKNNEAIKEPIKDTKLSPIALDLPGNKRSLPEYGSSPTLKIFQNADRNAAVALPPWLAQLLPNPAKAEMANKQGQGGQGSRIQQNPHKLSDMLFMVLSATIGGACSLKDVLHFIEAREKWYAAILGLKHGLPPRQLFFWLLSSLNAHQFDQYIKPWLREAQGVNPEGAQLTDIYLWQTPLGFVMGKIKHPDSRPHTRQMEALIHGFVIKNYLFMLKSGGHYGSLLAKIATKKGYYLAEVEAELVPPEEHTIYESYVEGQERIVISEWQKEAGGESCLKALIETYDPRGLLRQETYLLSNLESPANAYFDLFRLQKPYEQKVDWLWNVAVNFSSIDEAILKCNQTLGGFQHYVKEMLLNSPQSNLPLEHQMKLAAKDNNFLWQLIKVF